MDMFNYVRVALEQGKFGGVYPSYEYTTARLYTLFESEQTVRLSLEVCFNSSMLPVSLLAYLQVIVVLFYVYYSVIEVVNAFRHGIRYFFSLSVAFHNLNIVVYMIVWVYKLLAFSTVPGMSASK